jgi:predicted AAA+ superfamily ATPase
LFVLAEHRPFEVPTLTSGFYPRFLDAPLRAALADTPVVMVTGPRQAGKTTLVREIAGAGWEYRTLDDAAVLEAARRDPVGFVRAVDRLAIDEIQRAPDLLLAIKKSVDEDRRPGRFILTGSANVMTLPTVSESLAGRVELATLLPLSRAEIIGRQPTFLDGCFAGAPPTPVERQFGEELLATVLSGGYPEAISRAVPARQQRWYADYVETIMQRDVRDISGIQKLADLPRLLRVLAEYSGKLVNLSAVGGEMGMHHSTIGGYVTVMEQLYLLARLQPWSRNELKRLVKTPKLHFLDTGLLAAMQGLSLETLALDRNRTGPLLETFVHGELRKQATWRADRLSFLHYLDKEQNEVDFVVENGRREIVGIEVKAAATVVAGDFRGLGRLKDASGDAFRVGVVLYDGDHLLPFGDRMFAAPFPSLWS